MKNKQNVIIGLSIGVVSLIVLMVIYTVFQSPTTEDPVKPNPDSEITIETEDGIKIDLVEYEVFEIEELKFKFLIAKFRVKSDESIHIGLDNFKTSDNIVLDDVDSYLFELEKNGMYVGAQNVTFEILSNENSVIANLFIPIEDLNQKSVELFYADENEYKFFFDLTVNINENRDDLGYSPDDIITDGKSYEMSISNVIEITGETLYRNTQVESYPSTAELYAFKMNITSLTTEEVIIEEAKYIVDESNLEFIAFSMEYESEKRDNILGKSVQENDEGYLLFMTLNPQHEPITYKGKVLLKLKGIENWIEVKVDL